MHERKMMRSDICNFLNFMVFQYRCLNIIDELEENQIQNISICFLPATLLF